MIRFRKKRIRKRIADVRTL